MGMVCSLNIERNVASISKIQNLANHIAEERDRTY